LIDISVGEGFHHRCDETLVRRVHTEFEGGFLVVGQNCLEC
jgi:hypothetical protein